MDRKIQKEEGSDGKGGRMMEESSVKKSSGDKLVGTKVAEKADGHAGQYLTFKLAGEIYGLELLKVREIMGLMEITKIPRMPASVRGVINLRGTVIPVVGLRTKFGMDVMQDTNETCIIVVEVKLANKSVLVGILVDAVSEVLHIAGADIEDAPPLGDVNTEFILGMAKSGKGSGVTILLDIEHVLKVEEVIVGMGAAASGSDGGGTGTKEDEDKVKVEAGAGA